jgi:tetratricopeptide (TPR) repeat protein
VATSLANLAQFYKMQGKYAEAEPLQQRALAIQEQTQGPQHPDTIAILNNYKVLLSQMGREDEATVLKGRSGCIIPMSHKG